MVIIKGQADQKCFICSTKEKTVEVSFEDKTFRGVLCLTHIYEKLKPEVPRVTSGGGGKTS